MELDIKLTGILNIYTLAEGETCNAFGTEVAPRVQAHHHQRTLLPCFLNATKFTQSTLLRHLLPPPRPNDRRHQQLRHRDRDPADGGAHRLFGELGWKRLPWCAFTAFSSGELRADCRLPPLQLRSALSPPPPREDAWRTPPPGVNGAW